MARSPRTRSGAARRFLKRSALRAWFAAPALLAGLLLGEALLPRAAQASTVLALTLEEMTRKADVIAVAVASERQTRRDANGALIVTDVSLEVETPLKGVKAGERIVATVLGGELDGLALQVPGEANFATGQRAIVFLAHSPDRAELRVVGMSQGVLPIVGDDATPMVAPGGQDAALLRPDAQGALQEASPALVQPQPLSDLLARIRGLLSPAPARKTGTGKSQPTTR